MAIDTRNERASALLFSFPASRVLPDPNGGIDQADRQQVAVSYCGILASGGVTFQPCWAMRANILLGGGDV